MMNIFTLFNLLSKQEQADILLEEGKYLYTRQEPEFLIDLYSLDDFFVEVYYHKHQKNLTVIKSFYAKDQDNDLEYDWIPRMTVAWKIPYNIEASCGCA